MNNKFWICMDVGGTQIKAGVLTQSGKILGKLRTFSSNAKHSKTEICNHFVHIIRELYNQIKQMFPQEQWKICGMGMAFPGPFDYDAGICLMQNLDKYDALYGISLREEIAAVLKKDPVLQHLRDIPFIFCNDVEAFALGENALNPGFTRGLYVCIGTGCGSSFLADGKPADNSIPGVPPNGWIYGLPFKDATIDDYLSKRGICKLALQEFGKPLEGKELSELAQEQDKKALHCFDRFGNYLNEALSPILYAFKPNALVLGGQLMKSFSLFGKPLQQFCNKNRIALRISPESSQSALIGLFHLFCPNIVLKQ